MAAPRYQAVHGDCRIVMHKAASLGHAWVDSIVTDPPYHLTTVKRFGKAGAAPPTSKGATGVYKRAARGFIGVQWDGGDVAFVPETWKLCLDLLPPGGHLIAFSSPKTYHRLACAIEDAGFEIRDQLMWLYGTGFPKSHATGKHNPEHAGWGTALKPAHEPIVLARKPLQGTVAKNMKRHGVGAINIEATRLVVGNRWPANVVHDGQDAARMLQDAARFFYCAKASKEDRAGSDHPTVKPLALMRWLVRMVTPPGGTVLDPFAGTGTTGQAALEEGMRAVMIEADDGYYADLRFRMAGVNPGSPIRKRRRPGHGPDPRTFHGPKPIRKRRRTNADS